MLGHVVAKEREHYVAMSNNRGPQRTDHNQIHLNRPALVGTPLKLLSPVKPLWQRRARHHVNKEPVVIHCNVPV
jgi:hypothetical protein